MIGNRRHGFWHMALMVHFSIIIIIIHIIHIIIIFLYQPASTNLIAYFPLKPMGVCFYITGHLFHVLKIICLQVTATSFVISAHIDDHKAIQMHIKQLVNERLLHYLLSKSSWCIPKHSYGVLKARVAIFQNWKVTYIYGK